MLSNEHRPVAMTVAPDGRSPIAVQMPAITIDVKSDTDPSLVEAIFHRIASVMNPSIYNEPPPCPIENDDYGTPLGWIEYPETYDVSIQRDAMMNRTVNPMTMIAMRMKWGVYKDGVQFGTYNPPVPFEHMSVHLNAEKAIIFIVCNKQPVTLTDDLPLFPSDALVTQLRMLETGTQPTTGVTGP